MKEIAQLQANQNLHSISVFLGKMMSKKGTGLPLVLNQYKVQQGGSIFALIFQFPIYLEPNSQLPIYQVAIEPWFQIYRQLEDEGLDFYPYMLWLTHLNAVAGSIS